MLLQEVIVTVTASKINYIQKMRDILQKDTIPQLKQAIDALDTASEDWGPKFLALSAATKHGTNDELIGALSEASKASDKLGEVLGEVRSRLEGWKEEFDRFLSVVKYKV
ncbi:hypothetical protein N0V90_008736 [Kalmusia sp. IMI 367209]|nr:hypothetical protein N0V90_008736 [Kalmusia sp. IMI 367209]